MATKVERPEFWDEQLEVLSERATAILGDDAVSVAIERLFRHMRTTQTPVSFDAFKAELDSVAPELTPYRRRRAGPGLNFEGLRAVAINTPLLTLIRQAYQVQGFQIVGGASWITSDRFDIWSSSGAFRSM